MPKQARGLFCCGFGGNSTMPISDGAQTRIAVSTNRIVHWPMRPVLVAKTQRGGVSRAGMADRLNSTAEIAFSLVTD
jgi:hypothetical protein